jgi:hypothetical protein
VGAEVCAAHGAATIKARRIQPVLRDMYFLSFAPSFAGQGAFGLCGAARGCRVVRRAGGAGIVGVSPHLLTPRIK